MPPKIILDLKQRIDLHQLYLSLQLENKLSLLAERWLELYPSLKLSINTLKTNFLKYREENK